MRLDAARRFYLVSGSNMAGKSTLLRTIGINAVLGSAGAPVVPCDAAIVFRRLCIDFDRRFLSEGKSKFLAEVERFRETLAPLPDRSRFCL